MKRLPMLFGILLLSVELSAQTARVELDHVFIVVPAFGRAEADALQKLGFSVDTAVTRHEGQGTASRSILLDNVYLELLWVDSTVSVSAESRQVLSELAQASIWRSSGASPFGLALRRTSGPENYGVPFQRYSAAWMNPGSYISALRQPNEERSADVFVVPAYMSLPAWIDFVKQQSPTLLQHVNGSRKVTAVSIAGPPVQRPSVLRALTVEGLSFSVADEPLMTLELDSGRRGEVHDVRPLMPLLIRR